LNLKINRIYLLKESFRDFWQLTSKEIARKFMAQWLTWAMVSKIKPMQNFVLLLKRHEEALPQGAVLERLEPNLLAETESEM
jgi:hypothetical protein